MGDEMVSYGSTSNMVGFTIVKMLLEVDGK